MQYHAPTSVDAAVELLAGAGPGGRVLAGGTDLLVQLRSGILEPEVVVDIKKIDATRTISSENGGFRVGAAVAGCELGAHAGICAAWPGVVESAELIGSTQIQGRASMGGNLCNGSPAADTTPALIAASATVTVAGPGGRREIAVEDVCTAPGHTSLEKGEFVVSFFLPARAAGSSDAYLRFIPRTEMDIAVVGVGVSLTVGSDGICTAARVGLGAVAPTALHVKAADAALVGTDLNDAALEAAAAACRAACKPIDDKRGTIEFRTKVAGVLTIRSAKIALERARS